MFISTVAKTGSQRGWPHWLPVFIWLYHCSLPRAPK